jgi:hypothetical protein
MLSSTRGWRASTARISDPSASLSCPRDRRGSSESAPLGKLVAERVYARGAARTGPLWPGGVSRERERGRTEGQRTLGRARRRGGRCSSASQAGSRRRRERHGRSRVRCSRLRRSCSSITLRITLVFREGAHQGHRRARQRRDAALEGCVRQTAGEDEDERTFGVEMDLVRSR